MAITLNTNNGFVPSTDIGNGVKGLHSSPNSNSDATLNGSDLSDGLSVTVLFPKNSPNPQFRWTGKTSGTNSAKTSCWVQLKQVGPGFEAVKGKPGKPEEQRHPKVPDDTGSTVSVNATDTTTGTSSNTITPPVPVGS